MPEFISILRWIRDIVYPQLLETNENVKIVADNMEEVKALNTSIEDGVLPFERIVITVTTIGELLELSHSNGDIVIVKDLNRGGTFIYDATQRAVNNGGTIFDGWVRQFNGAVNVKWFGAIDDDDGSLTTTNSKDAFTKCFEYLNSIGGGTIYLPKDKTGGYFLNGDDTTQVTTPIEIVAEEGVYLRFIYSGGITNSPFASNNLKYNRELKKIMHNFGFNTYIFQIITSMIIFS